MTAAILEARGLTKRYGDRAVVDRLDLSCRRGTVLGLLGPNGAGKTTTLRMLYGFVPPDDGAIFYAGKSFSDHRSEAKRSIGVCTQDDSLDYDFTVAQNLFIYASYFRPRVENLGRRVADLLDRFELTPYANASPHVLSGGFVRRLLIARSIVHQPSVLFLDEPTTGLDPSARLDVWELIDGMRAEGLAIVLTTHYMDEAERLSDELLVIHQGRAIVHGEPHRVIDTALGDHVVLVPRGEPARGDIEAWLRSKGAQPVATVLGELRVPVSKEILIELTARFKDATWQVRPPNLDDLFIALARQNGRFS
ncbi:MAG TPA: ABC transporter ATP-binding protein [Polyangiales bacterium]|jgi:lipooligosaccharide transport system ATP-binding protein|nr:ABC transporter ATP-binding protein [Polyangiales bacterium]